MLLYHIILFSWILFQFSQGDLHESDQTTLIDFYKSLTDVGDLYWNLVNNLCGQDGVTCDSKEPQRVTKLDLSFKTLKGTLPTQLGNLPNLIELNLFENQFSGPIPTQFQNLRNLQTLSLFYNQLNGTIPTEIEKLADLYYLYLDHNPFSGPIPTQLGNLKHLKTLSLYHNQLSGSIPTQLGLLTNLEELALSYNQLSGTIPSQIENLIHLKILNLDSNQLSGTIPNNILSLSLNELYLGDNYWNCPIVNYSTILDNDYFKSKKQCCGKGGVFVNEECICSSGYLGTYCDIFLGGSCSFPTSSPIKRYPLGELNVKNITNNLVQVIISVPGIEKRTVTSIVFGDSITSNNSICTYPGPSFTKSFENSLCQDTFTSSISVINLIQKCGFDLTTNGTGNFKEYDGRIWMTMVEYLGRFRGADLTRTVSSSLNLMLSLPSNVTVNGSISLFGVAEAVFVLTDQSYNETTDSGVISMTSNLKYPFKFSGATFIGASNFTIQDSIPQDQTCEESSGNCIQTTTFIIQDISTNGCTFSGDYQFEWTQTCRGSNCLPELNPMNVTVSLESSNICSSIKVYSSISGVLGSYEHYDFSTPQSGFIVGNTIYFKADFISDVEVDHYELVNLYIISDSKQRYLLQDRLITTIGTANSLLSNGPQFLFRILVGTNDDEDLIISASSDIAITFEVFVEYEIFYKTTFKKRSIQSQKLILSKKILVSSSYIHEKVFNLIEANSVSSSSPTFISSFPLIFISVILFMYF